MNAAILASVGRAGANQLNDVVTIQTLLNSARAKNRVIAPMQFLVDGVAGPKTIAGIEALQKHFVPNLKTPAGTIEPNSPTLQKLNQLAGYLPPLNDGISYLTPNGPILIA